MCSARPPTIVSDMSGKTHRPACCGHGHGHSRSSTQGCPRHDPFAAKEPDQGYGGGNVGEKEVIRLRHQSRMSEQPARKESDHPCPERGRLQRHQQLMSSLQCQRDVGHQGKQYEQRRQVTQQLVRPQLPGEEAMVKRVEEAPPPAVAPSVPVAASTTGSERPPRARSRH